LLTNTSVCGFPQYCAGLCFHKWSNNFLQMLVRCEFLHRLRCFPDDVFLNFSAVIGWMGILAGLNLRHLV
jgi:hypothetical protein